MLECVVNISEGRDNAVLSELARACGADLLDVHVDPDHNRSVFTLLGIDAPRRLTARAVELLTIDTHQGVHPRIGVVDVVPFVPLDGSTLADAERERDAFAHWASSTWQIPCFLYGQQRTLPHIRAHAWKDLAPDTGPTQAHSTAGAISVGARQLLIAYNVWLGSRTTESAARAIVQAVRGDGIRTLALAVGDFWQVSMNLIEPERVGPDRATARVIHQAKVHGVDIDRCELVGLMSEDTLTKISPSLWTELDLAPEKTIEYRRKFGYEFAT